MSEGDVVRLELLDGEPGSEIVFDKVLMAKKAGDDVEVGSPFVEKGQVTAKNHQVRQRQEDIILNQNEEKEIISKRQGHRQWFTDVEIALQSPRLRKKKRGSRWHIRRQAEGQHAMAEILSQRGSV